MTAGAPRWRCMLFDFDGTLADTAPDLAAAANAMRTARGMDALPLAALRPYVSQGARGMMREAFACHPGDECYEALKEEFLDRYERALAVETRLFDGMDAVLDALESRGVRWGIVTNKSVRFMAPLARALALEARASTIVCGDTTPHAKPHPAPLLHAAREAGVEPAACVYVGDDHRDIVAGRAAGMATIAAAWGYCGDVPVTRWEADHVVERPQQLIAML